MIKNKNVTYRTPRVLTAAEIISCKKYIEKQIMNYITGGPKSFCVKDIFGYDNWDWSQQHPTIQCIYDAWCKHYAKKYSGKWTCDEIYCEAYKQAGISLGHLVKQTARDMQNITFKIANPTCWNIIYTVV